MPGGGDERLITPRRLLIRSVCASWLFWLTSESTCSWAACPLTAARVADTPRSFTLTTVDTLPRSVASVTRYAWSAAFSVPVLTAATTGTGIRLVPPNGAARSAACWLGALAGRNALLLAWVTLASEGNAFGITPAATIQRTTTTQRNLTENRPIALKMSSACTRPE